MPAPDRPTGLATRLRLPRRTIRLRLTALYGALSLLSGAGLLAITISLAGAWSGSGTTIAPAHGGTQPDPSTQARLLQQQAQAAAQHAVDSSRLLGGAATGLAIMAVASVALGWIVAGRVLRPLRAITAATRRISEDDLHLRLAVSGSSDELTDLSDTIDGLLARLQAAFEAQRTFVANASHELRTPLTAIRARLEVALADPAATVATLQTACHDAISEEQQQERLIDALLTLARSQRGLDRRQPVDVADLTSQVLRRHQPDATRRGVTITASITTARVHGDPHLLQRMITNLVDNALRHNIRHGQADIEVTTDGAGRPHLKISNTGPVIPASEAAQLLQPFQRRSRTRSATDDGLGLGLSIVAAIAKAHHASLTIKPPPDGGLTIEISFPTTDAAANPQWALATA